MRIYGGILAVAAMGLVVQGIVMVNNGVSLLAVVIPDAIILIFGRLAYAMGKSSRPLLARAPDSE